MSVSSTAALDRAPMFRVSLILEALRARPVLMFWVAALAQGTLWTLVPSLFYPAPPGEVPLVLAVGTRMACSARRTGRRSPIWLANIAFRLGGIDRRLSAVAALRGRHLLGGVRARPPHRRRRACRDGDPADGGHQRVHGADAGIRPRRARDAAHRADAAVRLSRARRQQARRLDRSRGHARPAAAHHLRGLHPARADDAVRRRDRAAAAAASARSGPGSPRSWSW